MVDTMCKTGSSIVVPAKNLAFSIHLLLTLLLIQTSLSWADLSDSQFSAIGARASVYSVGGLYVTDATGIAGSTATISVGVVAASDIKDFGFDIIFDHNKVTYDGGSRAGTGIEDWESVFAGIVSNGVLRVGGMAGLGTPINDSTLIVNLNFSINLGIEPGGIPVSATNFKDGLAGVVASPGNILVELQPTPTPTHTPTSTNTSAPTATSTNTPIFTNTPTHTPTYTNTPTSQETQAVDPTETSTPTPTNTSTSLPTNTFTSTPTQTDTPMPPTPTSTPTSTNTQTNTPIPQNTNTPTPTNSPTYTATYTPTNIWTATWTATPTATNTPTTSAVSSYTWRQLFKLSVAWGQLSLNADEVDYAKDGVIEKSDLAYLIDNWHQ
jgi:hypothetical protein